MDPVRPILDKVSEFAREHEMLSGEGRILVAVSGGPDSTALLHILNELAPAGGFSLAVAHLDHAIRPESSADAEFVREMAAALALPFVVERADVPARAQKEKISLELAARRARIEFLTRAAEELGADRIAGGHTADDQAETVLFRILRGTGVRGLAGIPPVRVDRSHHGLRFIRPLLSLRRGEIVRYLNERGLKWRTDATNLSEEHTRNRIRNALLPQLEEEYNPRLREALVRLSELARSAARRLEAEAAAALDGGLLRTGAPGRVELAASGLREMDPVLLGAVLQEALARLVAGGGALAPVEITSVHLEALRRLVERGESGRRAELPGGITAELSYESLIIARASRGGEADDEPPGEWSVTLPVPGECELPDGRRVRAELREGGGDFLESFLQKKGKNEEALDYDAAGAPTELVVRSRRPGDVFRPLGASGSRKLKEFLIDRKVPRAERGRIPLVCSREGGGRILWVAPYAIAEEARVTKGTSRLLLLRLEEE